MAIFLLSEVSLNNREKSSRIFRFQVKSDFTCLSKHLLYKNIKKKPTVVANNLFIIIIYGRHPVDTGAVADGMWYNHGGAGGLSLT